MVSARRFLASFTIPQLLLLLAALAYGGVFAALLAYGRPGLGLGQALCVPVILAAAATSTTTGVLAGTGALFLYELAINYRNGFSWEDFAHPSAATRLATYVAVGALTGFLAQRGRRMLAQTFVVLDDLIDLAHGRLENAPVSEAASEPRE